jgi:hypothetical protein
MTEPIRRDLRPAVEGVALLLLLLRIADALRPPLGRWRFVAAALHIAAMLAALFLVLYAVNLQHLMGL